MVNVVDVVCEVLNVVVVVYVVVVVNAVVVLLVVLNVVVVFLNQLQAGNKLTIFGAGYQTRKFSYILMHRTPSL